MMLGIIALILSIIGLVMGITMSIWWMAILSAFVLGAALTFFATIIFYSIS